MSAKKGKTKPVAEGAKVESAAPAKENKSARVRGRARAEIAVQGPASGKPPTLSPGTKLVREYKGKKVTVTCMEGGRFEWDGKFFKSLSALATAVSGQHCSGPRFFGLVKPRAGKPARPKGKK
jgi:hypothetical protein